MSASKSITLELTEAQAIEIYLSLEEKIIHHKKPGLHHEYARDMYVVMASIAADVPDLQNQFGRIAKPKRCSAREFPTLPTGKRCSLREHPKRIAHYDIRTSTEFEEPSK